MDIIEFANAVVGVPFKSRGRGRDGWDCWGLVIALYRECFGIELVDPPYESALKSAEVAEVYEKQKLLWSEIPAGQERAGDVIVLRYGSWPCHIGVVAQPGTMLHVEFQIETCVEPYNRTLWKERIIGFFRHADRS